MIRKLFFLTALLLVGTTYSQVFPNYGDNFENLNLGDIQDQGNAPHTWHHNGGLDAQQFFQVENNSPAQGKVLSISGPSASDAWFYTSAARNIWRNAFDVAWNARTVGNDVIVVEFDFNPGLASVSENNFSVEIMGNNNDPVAGVTIGKNGLGIRANGGKNVCHIFYGSTIAVGTPSD